MINEYSQKPHVNHVQMWFQPYWTCRKLGWNVTLCGQTFLERTGASYSGPKTVNSNMSRTQALWWDGVESLATAIYTSVMAALMQKGTLGSFPGTSLLFSTRWCWTTFCTHYKGLATEEKGRKKSNNYTLLCSIKGVCWEKRTLQQLKHFIAWYPQ